MSALIHILLSVAAGLVLFYICSCRGGLMSRKTRRLVAWAYTALLAVGVCKLLAFLPQAREFMPWAEHLQDAAIIALLWLSRHRWEGGQPAEFRTDA